MVTKQKDLLEEGPKIAIRLLSKCLHVIPKDFPIDISTRKDSLQNCEKNIRIIESEIEKQKTIKNDLFHYINDLSNTKNFRRTFCNNFLR